MMFLLEKLELISGVVFTFRDTCEAFEFQPATPKGQEDNWLASKATRLGTTLSFEDPPSPYNMKDPEEQHNAPWN